MRLPDDGVILGSELLVNSVQLTAVDQLDPGDDVVFVTEVNTVLGLRDTTDQGPRDAQLPHHQPDLASCVSDIMILTSHDAHLIDRVGL